MANFTTSFYPDSFLVTANLTLNADVIDQSVFVCPAGFSCYFLGASESHAVAGSGGACTIMLTKQEGTETPATGLSLLNSEFDLEGTAETPQVANVVATPATRLFQPGDRLGVNVTGTTTDVANVVITAYFYRVS